MNAEQSYWLSVAAQWIQSKSQTQIAFPQTYQQLSFPQQAPEPPRISNHEAMPSDNLGEADMDIEDVKEDEPAAQVWNNNWRASPVQQKKSVSPPVITQQKPPNKTKHRAQKFFYKNKHQGNRSGHHNSRFDQPPQAPQIQQIPQAPEAPIIGQIDSSQPVDMVLDSGAEEDQENAISEDQRRKKLPLWIREGLERIEREKKQEAERLEREKELLLDEENRKKIMEEALKELEKEKIAKSKYVSD
jgi:splicing factor, arginine/serine-rich 18